MPGFMSLQRDSKGQATGCVLLRSRPAGRAAGLVAHGLPPDRFQRVTGLRYFILAA